MDAVLLARTLSLRAAWRARDRWSTDRLGRHQQRALAALRRHAYERSPFYRRHHAGLLTAPLSELPPVTKAELMARFDDVVTVRGLRLADVESHLRELTDVGGDPGEAWRRRWWVAATAGTTGRRGVFVWSRTEWAAVLASYARANDWAGVRLGLRHPLRLAVVRSLNPTHQSAVVGASVRSRLVPTLRVDAAAPLRETVEALNGFAPRLLVGYASVLRELAAEQAESRLHIRPEAVMSASEVLSPAMEREIEAAWGTRPFDVYAATETAGIASSCELHRRHLYEDLVVCEVVDDAGAPVPAGTPGSRLLVTVLFSRTLPLIRYELTDRVVLDPESCACGRPSRVVGAVEGRTEDVLLLPGRDGGRAVRVHPNVFHGILESPEVASWQVSQETDGLHVLVTGRPGLDTGVVAVRLRAALGGAGAESGALRVEQVEHIPRTPLGKRPLIRALPPGSAHRP
ncbi:phenylacetate--CoA ligase family protein [Georgenia sp. EYE_87]|uniref:phenylacetate--CoA ligase family protein n=1 Tax=Georgenia sp. EYE_87 TaxID=2853448 RepID=UPI002005B6A0|nr:phenylacetate--CoA ligase family protein [Georgenia sp. EYE_87]MCK6210289.1 phenylacetate--CoA ligase family protein [Georgenia sp. EYE_87]